MTYEGELRATQRDPILGQTNPLASHKHSIRRAFHKQLEHLWATDRFLSRYRVHPDNPNLGEQPHAAADAMYGMWARKDEDLAPLVEVVAACHNRFGYRFVPLVTS